MPDLNQRELIKVFGREVVVEIGEQLDECGQFLVRVLVDAKVRYEASFTDKSEES